MPTKSKSKVTPLKNLKKAVVTPKSNSKIVAQRDISESLKKKPDPKAKSNENKTKPKSKTAILKD